ncbi:MAG: hypothetical protein CMN85_06090 [Spongiibacteraceae bacterium]|nr:hypothetical protein [Spongiibacteraceae bacterium]|tara:strand:+ start:1376 stop:1885 length:510 start_codon:yes stop_codon:yes gene_type:complete
MRELIQANIEVLEQFRQLLETVGRQGYAEAPALVDYGVGRHLRHVLDHYHALRAGLDSGTVDYDIRDRNSAVESDFDLACETISDWQRWLQACNSTERLLKVKSEISLTETQHVIVESTVQRELCYVAAHSTHHLAYASLIARMLGAEIDATVGLAPATASNVRSAGRA